ncbi:MAG: ABC transporter substrate-binding protein [Candidatus Accumulibacter sp.]|jgi:iron complex transport system substrate-binding protein|nr:ABC transporter substrate-binding protein [Accumulibacter sp.]
MGKIRLLALVSVLLLSAACDRLAEKARENFINMGDFSIENKVDYTEARDGAGRILALVPRGQPHPPGFAPTRVIETPVRRVVAYSFFDVGILRALGEADTVVGVTTPESGWFVDEMRKGFAEDRVTYVGEPDALDYERVEALHPDVVMTWDPSIVPMMDELGIPVLVTSTPLATCLATHIRFAQFLAPFFGREREAKVFYERVARSLEDIRERTRGRPKPKAMWGDIYEKRVLVEPGNAWVAELVGLAQSDYLFDDVYGTSCIEISLERFLYSGNDADIYFTYRSVKDGIVSKDALVRMNSLLASLKPLGPNGRAYSPLPHYSQSADRLDDILVEISAILHPEAYPDYKLQFFVDLPDHDPIVQARGNQP